MLDLRACCKDDSSANDRSPEWRPMIPCITCYCVVARHCCLAIPPHSAESLSVTRCQCAGPAPAIVHTKQRVLSEGGAPAVVEADLDSRSLIAQEDDLSTAAKPCSVHAGMRSAYAKPLHSNSRNILQATSSQGAL